MGNRRVISSAPLLTLMMACGISLLKSRSSTDKLTSMLWTNRVWVCIRARLKAF